ncbi:MAG: response regulator [Deltaproteobacteria bacterium]|nr:response regulator [Deltaproteobacteria bacterium]
MFDKSTRVLVVDDMATMRKLVMKVCADLGFTDVQEAADGEKAWSIINNDPKPIGLVISDWNMPHLTGLDLLKRVRADKRYAGTPFLLVTAEAESSQVTDAVKAGVDNYIVKPFTAATLTEKLEAIHKKRGGAAAA